ncbi:ras and ef-hand domain-containing protein [Anaeramoeba ignava]|uniref:Ras and ef-hand domain-containing protein n=1 Tax=Anaeramoeba ignava TaxID=1746090 RepID=A0A9Q0LYE5_ANAIG|nr:ras and ef-hand domain-containing protein [Anaeramoeba ignava]
MFGNRLKLVLVGNSLVGKSSILIQFCDSTFSKNQEATIGVDFRFSNITVNNEEIELQIWDTAGQERFRSITNHYYRNADAIMVVYDITNESSFTQLKNWYSEIVSSAPPQTKVMLVGNKADLENERAVQRERAEKLAMKYGWSYGELSAKTGEGIKESFEILVKETLSVYKTSQKKKPDTNVKIKENGSSKCC